MRYQIGVVGSAVDMEEEVKFKARKVGESIATHNHLLVTGGCGGIPYEAVKGAKNRNGSTLAISPASNRREHVEVYGLPTEGYDSFVFIGSGYKGRTIPLVRSCDAVIGISGRIGTMVELGIAYDEKKVIGLLHEVPGFSSEFNEWTKKSGKSGGEIIIDEDPEILVEKVIRKLDETLLL
ncbi:MAG: hypothetical protein J7K87_02085 [Candidatus Aenigmarchaeota archaeon]|nr:hypothetical protein [Candidatus Aenigmarchaeota archaeon]